MKTLTQEVMAKNGTTAGSKPESQIKRITPDDAKRMLATRSGTGIRQRPLSDRHVKRLAAQMKKGNWVLQYEPIIVSEYGFVIDGQHRLTAVVESGTTQPFLVIYGADEFIMPRIGIGVKRKSSDVLAMQGYENYKLLSSILLYIWKFYEKETLSPARKVLDTPQEYEYLDLAEKYPGAVQAASYASRHARSGILTGVQVGTLWYILGQISQGDRNVFFGKLLSGANLDEEDPIFLCREKLIKISIAKKSRMLDTVYKSTDIMALVIKSWNAFREDRTIKHLYFRNGERYPQPV